MNRSELRDRISDVIDEAVSDADGMEINGQFENSVWIDQETGNVSFSTVLVNDNAMYSDVIEVCTVNAWNSKDHSETATEENTNYRRTIDDFDVDDAIDQYFEDVDEYAEEDGD